MKETKERDLEIQSKDSKSNKTNKQIIPFETEGMFILIYILIIFIFIIKILTKTFFFISFFFNFIKYFLYLKLI